MKKFTCLFIVVLLSILCLQPSFACGDTKDDLRYPTSCPEAPDGIHYAQRDTSYLVSDLDGDFLFFGQLYICKYCKLKIVTEGSPHFGTPIYRYITSADATYIYWGISGIEVDPSDLEETNSSTLYGFVFYQTF